MARSCKYICSCNLLRDERSSTKSWMSTGCTGNSLHVLDIYLRGTTWGVLLILVFFIPHQDCEGVTSKEGQTGC